MITHFKFTPVLLMLGVLTACGDQKHVNANATAPALPVMQDKTLSFPAGHPQLALIGVTAAIAPPSTTVELPAKLVWDENRTQRIFPAFSGRIVRIGADLGGVIRAGQMLAELASPDFGNAQADLGKARSDSAKAKADIGRAQADVNRAKSDLALVNNTLARQQELFSAGILARKEVEQSQAETERAAAELARTQAEILRVNAELSRSTTEEDRARDRVLLYGKESAAGQKMTIASRMNGIVVERNINPGQEIRADQAAAPIFVITDPTSLWVQIDARETEMDLLQPKATFELVVPSLQGKSFSGTVSSVADSIEPTTRTIKIRGVVNNPQRFLKAEMLANAKVVRAARTGVQIPAAALMLRNSQHSVLVQTQLGSFIERAVKVSEIDAKYAVVASGLNVGESVVSENALLLARQFQQTAETSGSQK